jgi:hypothetical protein
MRAAGRLALVLPGASPQVLNNVPGHGEPFGFRQLQARDCRLERIGDIAGQIVGAIKARAVFHPEPMSERSRNVNGGLISS